MYSVVIADDEQIVSDFSEGILIPSEKNLKLRGNF